MPHHVIRLFVILAGGILVPAAATHADHREDCRPRIERGRHGHHGDGDDRDDDKRGCRGSGRLAVVIAGLPAGVQGRIQVTGPNDIRVTLTESATLTRLPPGRYGIRGEDLRRRRYHPTFSTHSVELHTHESAEVDVGYTVPSGASVSAPIRAAAGGVLDLGPASLTIPPGALSGDTVVTLASIGPHRMSDRGDPLGPVSDSFVVTASDGVTLSVPASLTLVPRGDALDGAQDLLFGTAAIGDPAVAAAGPVSLGPTRALTPNDELAAPEFGPLRAPYGQVGSERWVLAVPRLRFPSPTEGIVLEVPWYYQSGIPWCMPTSLTAMIRYFDVDPQVPDEPLVASTGSTMALANWQLAALQGQARNSGGGWPIDALGLGGSTTGYIWDADYFIPDSGAKGGFDDLLVYLIVVNTGFFGLGQHRPVAMLVDAQWHAMVVVGSDGEGLYIHDSNGPIARFSAWDAFHSSAWVWKMGAAEPVQTVWTAVLHDVPPRPEPARRGSLVLAINDLAYLDVIGNSAMFEWDGVTPHHFGYHFYDPAEPWIFGFSPLGIPSVAQANLSWGFRIANVTNVELPYQVTATLVDAAGNAFLGGPSDTRSTVVGPYSLSGYVSGSFATPAGSEETVYKVTLRQEGVLQDVKYIRYLSASATSAPH